MFDPHQLRVFIVAAETLNFSLAAKKLNLSQPAVTQTIQALENQLGEGLFLRSGRKLQLSETGESFLPVARQLVTLNLRAREVVDASRGQIGGFLTIACSTTPGKYVLPVVVGDFLRRYPRVSAQCLVVSRRAALEMLEKGEAHFAFSSSIEEFDHHYEFRPFISDPVRLIVPASHPWAARGEIEVEELKNERFILREECAGTFRVVKEALAQHGINIHELQLVLRMGNSEAIAVAVQRGVGVGFVSQMVLQNLTLPDVRVVSIRGIHLKQQIYMTRHRLNPVSSAAAVFWEELFAHQQAIQAELSKSYQPLHE
ncbi:MAG: LysR family transcriptional regulator [Chloroflexota bacterium]|nr:MAG: LysR family transcriptional regulator [Bellilinea sp.]